MSIVLSFTLILILSILYFPLNLIASVVLYLDAKQKNKNPVLWLAISLICMSLNIFFGFFGFIPIFIYFLMVKNMEFQEDENINKSYLKYLKLFLFLTILYIGSYSYLLIDTLHKVIDKIF